MLTTPDGKDKKCNIHHIKPMTPVDASTNAFSQFQDSIKKIPCNTTQHGYSLRSKVKLTYFFRSCIVHNSLDKWSFTKYCNMCT